MVVKISHPDSIADRLEEVPSSAIRRLFDIASLYPDVISLGIGEPDFDTPEFIKGYAKEALDRGLTHYSPNNGLKLYRDAVSAKLKKENGIDADPDKNIIATVGGNEGFLLSLSTFLRPGDEVLIPSPSFVTYSAIVRIIGGSVVEVGTTDERAFRVTAEDLENAVTDKTKCIIINSPNNPTGAVLSRRDLEEIAGVAVEHDLKVLSDEVYESLIYEGEEHVSIGSLSGMADRVITVNSFSKTYAMTGWRIGFTASDEATIAKMTKFQMYLAACPVTFCQYAAAMAMKDPRAKGEVEKMRSEYQRRRDFIYKRLASMEGLMVVKPKGAFYIFPRLDGRDDIQISEKLLTQAKVVAVPGSSFGKSGKSHLRMCYATSMEKIEIAMDRMDQFSKTFRM
jgi:aminotransferase